MAKKYDGWVIKSLVWRTPFYLLWTFRTTRTEAMRELEESWEVSYSKRRRRGEIMAVKVKLVEVED